MAQLDTQHITIQIKGVIEQNRRNEELLSILKMLQFSCEEVSALGFSERAGELRQTIEKLREELEIG